MYIYIRNEMTHMFCKINWSHAFVKCNSSNLSVIVA